MTSSVLIYSVLSFHMPSKWPCGLFSRHSRPVMLPVDSPPGVLVKLSILLGLMESPHAPRS